MGSLTPPSPLPACNGALTHNSSGGADSSVFSRDASGNVGMWPMNGSSISQSKVLPPPMAAAIFFGPLAAGALPSGMNGATVSSVATYGNAATSWGVKALNVE
jgi:hypothetical protein